MHRGRNVAGHCCRLHRTDIRCNWSGHQHTDYSNVCLCASGMIAFVQSSRMYCADQVPLSPLLLRRAIILHGARARTHTHTHTHSSSVSVSQTTSLPVPLPHLPEMSHAISYVFQLKADLEKHFDALDNMVEEIFAVHRRELEARFVQGGASSIAGFRA